MHSHHYPYHGPGPDHHPLLDHELDKLLRDYATADFYGQRSIERRIEQAVPGMVAPIFVASDDVQSRARRAVILFREAAQDWPHESYSTHPFLNLLRVLLEIQPELSIGDSHSSPLGAA